MVTLKGVLAARQQQEGFGAIGGTVVSDGATSNTVAFDEVVVTGAASAAEEGDFLAIKDHMQKARKLIAIREKIEQGDSFYSGVPNKRAARLLILEIVFLPTWPY